MGVPGILVARTDAEAASLLDSCGTNAISRSSWASPTCMCPATNQCSSPSMHLFESGVDEVRGHLMFAMPETQYGSATPWLEKKGLLAEIKKSAETFSEKHEGGVDGVLDKAIGKVLDTWQNEAELRTYRQAVAEAIIFGVSQGESFDMSPEQWLTFSARASWYAAREKAASMGVDIPWDYELAKTPEGYYQVRAVSSTPSPSLWRPLPSRISCGWRRRRRISTKRRNSPTRSTPSSRTR